MQGTILYSTDKFPTFATNLLDGPWSETHQSRCFKNALIRDFAVEDFEPYLPALLESSAFLCKALIRDNQIIGVISVQLSTHLLSRVMGDHHKWDEEQLGQSGKAYIVGGDFRVRHENAILYDEPQTQIPTMASPTRVNTDAVRAALRGESGTMLLQGPTGREVLCAYTNVRLGNGLWAILVEKELSEILAPISEALHRILPTMLFMLLAILFLGLWMAKNILGPIQLVTEKLNQLSRDETTKDSPTAQKDEAGKLLQAFDKMFERLKSHHQLMEQKILDLSDEKLAVQQAEMDLQKILQELPFGIQWKNLEGYIMGTNMAHELNFSQQRLPDLQTTIHNLESEFIRKGAGSTTINLTLLDTDHNPVYVSCYLKLRRDSGANPVGILICLKDITEQVRIKSKAHMEDKIKALQNFAHGFSQKIAPIAQNSEAISLLEQYANLDINPQIQLNLVSIIEDALKQHFAKTPARINMIIKSQIRFIHGNPSLLQQAFKALTKKVAEVMPADGTLRIEIRNEPLNDMLHIRVMEQDTEATIPDPFTVFDPYSKHKLAADGMALAIAFSIIRAHGGTIEVDSEPGIGTCFTIQIPVSNNFTSQNKGQI
jgi:methyl-accepting chemotaxis protein